uniref:Uncharacterized protein n=1 Tax=Moorena producens (strain JHB) TaxID=1454205 RepID=A0A1D9G5M8_MOOP1
MRDYQSICIRTVTHHLRCFVPDAVIAVLVWIDQQRDRIISIIPLINPTKPRQCWVKYFSKDVGWAVLTLEIVSF